MSYAKELNVDCKDLDVFKDSELICYFKGIKAQSSEDKVEINDIAAGINITQAIFWRSKLYRIPKSIFKKIPNLHSLDCSNNDIKVIEPGTFEGAEHLKYLILYGNGIQKLDGNIFTSLKSLSRIDISRNKITLIDDEAFSGLRELIVLNMEKNQLITLNDKIFTSLTNLGELDLDENQLESLNEKAFQNNKELRKVSLKKNKLMELPNSLFKQLEFLMKVDISHNHLKNVDISESIVEDVDIKENPGLQSLVVPSTIQEIDLKDSPLTSLKFKGITDLETNYLKFAENLNFNNLRNIVYQVDTDLPVDEVKTKLSKHVQSAGVRVENYVISSNAEKEFIFTKKA